MQCAYATCERNALDYSIYCSIHRPEVSTIRRGKSPVSRKQAIAIGLSEARRGGWAKSSVKGGIRKTAKSEVRKTAKHKTRKAGKKRGAKKR